jgi:hypothetical protein
VWNSTAASHVPFFPSFGLELTLPALSVLKPQRLCRLTLSFKRFGSRSMCVCVCDGKEEEEQVVCSKIDGREMQ